MAKKKVKVIWHTYGFKADDFSPRVWKILVKEFINMYERYCFLVNACIGDWNKSWDKIIHVANEMVENGICKDVNEYFVNEWKGGPEGVPVPTTRADWINNFCEYTVNLVNDEINSPYLRGYIIRKEDHGEFAAAFINKPNWKIGFTIEEVN